MTATRYGKALAAGATTQIPYNFYSEYAPGELGLTVYVDLLLQVSRRKKKRRVNLRLLINFFLKIKDKVSRLVGYNGTITVTDPEGSWFDIQL